MLDHGQVQGSRTTVAGGRETANLDEVNHEKSRMPTPWHGLQWDLGSHGLNASAVPKSLLLHPVHCLSLGFGAGLSPYCQGTVGTIVGLVLYWPVHDWLTVWASWAVSAVFFLFGIAACGHTAKTLGVHDHRAIVWDEITGYWITMSLAPLGGATLVAGFILFRILDIWKPWPIRWIDRCIGGGSGIMIDDAAAAVGAGGVLQLAAWAIP